MIRREDNVILRIGDWDNPKIIELTAHQFYELEMWFRMTEKERIQFLMDEVAARVKMEESFYKALTEAEKK